MSPKLSPPSIGEIMADQGNAIDSRYHLSAATRRQLNKVFPTHWSFLLGEIAMYSFIVLLLTGVYLTLFFDPSMQDVTYNGVYQPLRGVGMSKAFASALDDASPTACRYGGRAGRSLGARQGARLCPGGAEKARLGP